MNLKSKLNAEKNTKIENHALEFAVYIEPLLIESAQKGFSAFSIDLEDREDVHILRSDLFLKHLNRLLEGCKTEIEETERINLIFKNKYYTRKLVFSW